MNTSTYIIIYLVICASIALLVPIAKNRWEKYLKDFNRAYSDIEKYDYLDNQPLLPLRNILLKTVVIITIIWLTLLFFIFTPFILPFLIYYDKKEKDSTYSYSGTYTYECQSCGKIYEIESKGELEINRQCDCGGKLYLIFLS